MWLSINAGRPPLGSRSLPATSGATGATPSPTGFEKSSREIDARIRHVVGGRGVRLRVAAGTFARNRKKEMIRASRGAGISGRPNFDQPCGGAERLQNE